MTENHASPDAARLAKLGEAIHGPRWQTPLAADIGVADRTMRRWVAGASPIPAGVWAEIADQAEARATALAAIASGIRAGRM